VKLPRWLPHPAAWASAGALFVFATGVSMAMAFTLPPLFELMHTSPRLAWIGILSVWCAPVVAAAAGHNVLHAVLDLGDSKKVAKGAFGGSASLWAGFVAWAAIIFVTLTTGLVMLVLDPPPVDGPDAMWSLAVGVLRGVPGIVRTVVWVVLAAYVYDLERKARGTSDA
jgi:hypothetical protein